MGLQWVSEEFVRLVHEGGMRNHLLGNTAGEHSGEVEMLEMQRFRDFLPSKNAYMVFDLVGCDNCA